MEVCVYRTGTQDLCHRVFTQKVISRKNVNSWDYIVYFYGIRRKFQKLFDYKTVTITYMTKILQ
jgi:hypothetical protein